MRKHLGYKAMSDDTDLQSEGVDVLRRMRENAQALMMLLDGPRPELWRWTMAVAGELAELNALWQ
jgi:hypothetical protein